MNLYIIGAGSIGGFIAYHSSSVGEYNLRGFIDDDVSKINQKLFGLPVIGTLDYLLQKKNEIAVAVAIADPLVKKEMVNRLSGNSRIHFPTFIHPSVWFGEKVKIGRGSIIYPGVTINYESVIGDFVTVNMNSSLGHNCHLMDYSTLSPGVDCGGFTTLGTQSFLGIGSCTLQSVKIGKKSIVGAGAVIIEDIPDHVTVVGNPGRIIKSLVKS